MTMETLCIQSLSTDPSRFIIHALIFILAEMVPGITVKEKCHDISNDSTFSSPCTHRHVILKREKEMLKETLLVLVLIPKRLNKVWSVMVDSHGTR